ncbi:hypothetical protein [Methanofollis liminatans]|nr:hypothetical protein [Methanofollis liminatans]
MSRDEIISSSIEVPYGDLFRYNEKYVGKVVHMKGQVLQVSETGTDDFVVRLSTKDSGYGYYDDIVWVEFRNTKERILEDDMLDVYGEVVGIQKYTAVLGNEVSIPAVVVKVYSIVDTGEIAVDQLSSATSLSVSTMSKNWDSDADDDGIIIYPTIKDSNGNSIKWAGLELPVSVKIYTTNYNSNFQQYKDKLVYTGTGTLSSWEDGNMFSEGGIKVPYTQINAPSGEDYGWTYVTVTLPDGKQIEGVDKFTSLR